MTTEQNVKTNDSIMKKLTTVLGNETELIVIRGQLKNPQKVQKEDGSGYYYTFQLKSIRQSNPDEAYSQGYNTFYCIMSSNVAKTYTDEQMSGMKENEVIALCSLNARAKTTQYTEKTTGEVVERTYNNITLYISDLLQTRSIQKELTNKKAINL